MRKFLLSSVKLDHKNALAYAGLRRGSNAGSESRARTLASNVAWNFVGNFVYAGCQWAMLVVIVRAGSATLVGQFAFALAIVSPVMLLFSLQLRGVQATDARNRFELREYLSLRLITTVLAALAIIASQQVFKHPRDVYLVLLSVLAMKAVDACCDVFSGHFQKHERMDLIARSLMLRGVLSIIALSGILASSNSLPFALIGIAIAWLLVLIWHDIPAARELPDWLALRRHGLSGNAASLLRLTYLALPAGLAATVVSLELNIPRYFLETKLGLRELGFFAAIASLLAATNLVVNAIHQPIIPKMARAVARSRKSELGFYLAILSGAGLLLGGLAVVAATQFGQFILTLALGTEYANHHELFVELAFAYMLRYIGLPAASALRAEQAFWSQLSIQLTGLLILTIGCVVLIPERGLLGASQSCIWGGGVIAALNWLCLLGSWLVNRSKPISSNYLGITG